MSASVSGRAGTIDVEQFGLLTSAGTCEQEQAEVGGLVHLYATSWAEEIELLQILGLWAYGRPVMELAT